MMRLFMVMGLILSLPLAAALADDSSYRDVHYGSPSQPAQGLMEYYDDGGMARNMLGPNLLTDSGSSIHQSPLDYSTPQDNYMRSYSSDSSEPSDSLLSQSRPAVLNAPGDIQNSVQP